MQKKNKKTKEEEEKKKSDSARGVFNFPVGQKTKKKETCSEHTPA